MKFHETRDGREIVWTGHSKQRVREVYPLDSQSHVLQMAERTDPDVVWAITQRRSEAAPTDAFYTTHDFQGIFVCREQAKTIFVITLLRMSPEQQRILRGDKTPESLGPERLNKDDVQRYTNEAMSMLGNLTTEPISPKTAKKLLLRILELCAHFPTETS